MSMSRTHLKAGRYVIVDVDKGIVQLVTRYTGIEQKNRKKKFVFRNLSLIAEAAAHGTSHGDFQKSSAGYKIVKLARKKLGYSDKTGSGDIYFSLVINAKRIKP